MRKYFDKVLKTLLITFIFLASLWLSSMKYISFYPWYLLNTESICSKGIKLSCLEAMKIPGHVTYFTVSSRSTSSILKSAFDRIIGLMYLNTMLRTIYGKFVLCLPIYRNNLFREAKGLSNIVTLIAYRCVDRYLRAE